MDVSQSYWYREAMDDLELVKGAKNSNDFASVRAGSIDAATTNLNNLIAAFEDAVENVK